jgi:hypothetical protein
MIEYLINAKNLPELNTGMLYAKDKILVKDPREGLRDKLFGKQPDCLYAAYRLRELYAILQATEFAEYLDKTKSIVYYPKPEDDVFFNLSYKSHATDGIVVLGNLSSSSSLGRMSIRLLAEVESGELSIYNFYTQQSQTYTLGSAQTLYPVRQTGLQLKFDTIPVSGTWDIRSYAKPESLNNIFSTIKPLELVSLFVGEEPITTFKNLWDSHPVFSYKISGLLLALIYKTWMAKSA